MKTLPIMIPCAFRQLFVLASLAALSACGTLGAPKPPSPPTLQEISANVQQVKTLEKGAVFPNTTTTDVRTIVTAIDAASAGYTLVDVKCNEFFNSVQDWSNTVGYARKEVTLVGAAAAGVLGAISATATSIALTAIGFGLTADSLDNFQNFALFTPKPTSVYKLVRSAMDTYRKAAPPTDNTLFNGSVLVAQDYVAQYAFLCTYAGIQQFVEQAVATATTTASSAGMFSESDKIVLPQVNVDVGLPTSPLLTSAAYTQLAWYLSTLYKLPAAQRDAFLTQYFANIKTNLQPDANGNLKAGPAKAAELLAGIAQRNEAFAKAIASFGEANKAVVAAIAAPAGVGAPMPLFISPSSLGTGGGPPSITIR